MDGATAKIPPSSVGLPPGVGSIDVPSVNLTSSMSLAGWNLINEPRCYQCGGVLVDWIGEMASHVKALDPNHLLSVGEEGFYPAGLAQVCAC